MFDRIEAGTYLIAAAATEGNLKIKNINPKIITTEIKTLRKIGAKIFTKKDELQIVGSKKIKSTNDQATRMIKKGIEKGIIIADLQTKGRGQYGKKWISQKGNLFMSVFYKINKKKG